MDLHAINSYFNFVRSVLSDFNFVSPPSVFWDTVGAFIFSIHVLANKKMLMSFGYIETFLIDNAISQ